MEKNFGHGGADKREEVWVKGKGITRGGRTLDIFENGEKGAISPSAPSRKGKKENYWGETTIKRIEQYPKIYVLG